MWNFDLHPVNFEFLLLDANLFQTIPNVRTEAASAIPQLLDGLGMFHSNLSLWFTRFTKLP